MAKRIFCAVMALAAAAPALAQTAAPAADQRWALIDTYCGKCHNSTDWAGGVAFDAYTPADVPNDIEVWESVALKLRGRLMPPPGNKQPTQAEIDGVVGWLETSLDARKETPRAGHVTAQRMNRTEYANAVRSLLGVEIKVEDLLPPEIEMHGFDNIAAVLSVSPSFLDQYIGAARYIAKRAVGDPKASVGKSLYLASQSEGGQMPLGSAGGNKFTHFFPADGEYKLSIVNEITGTAYPNASLFRRTVVILLDGKEIFRADVGGKDDLGIIDKEAVAGANKVMARFRDIPFRTTSGSHQIIVTAVERARVLSDETIGGVGGGGRGGGGGLGQANVEISGPHGETSVSSSPSRDRIFVCYPKSAAEERPCAEQIARHMATRAYRRPANDADIAKLMAFYDAGRREIGHFDGGVQEIVMGAISSPDFLYRVIAPRGDGQAPQPLSGLELASRLAFFLWSDVPDDELRKLAIEGRLADAKVYEQQVARMLQDRRAAALVDSFALRWLNVDDMKAVNPDTNIYRGFNENLRRDFATEIRMYLNEALLGNNSVLDLLNADYTWLNQNLANHYGIRGVTGQQFRRVQLADQNRFGLLGKAAVLLRTSYADRTSPVLRGAWVLERLIGTPPTPPPPGVETNLAAPEGQQQPTTLRARLESHRAVQSCNQCHGVIDPLGLALENFDVTGAYRTREIDSRLPVDASTVLPDGTPINGVVQLREALSRRPEQFVWALTQRLMMYGIGREIEAQDMPQVRQIVRDAAAGGYRFFDLVQGVAKSDAFRMQGPAHEEGADKKTTVASVQPAK